jgi:hypothetical protein
MAREATTTMKWVRGLAESPSRSSPPERGVKIPNSARRRVWNASYIDGDRVRELEERIKVQSQSLERIQEEISAACSATPPDQLARLKAQRRQRADQLQKLLSQYKEVAGEEYHDENTDASVNLRN